MGNLESRNARAVRQTKINRAIIGVVAVAGIVAVAAVVPNVLGALGRTKYARQLRYRTRSRFSRLITEGYITLTRKEGASYVRLTKKGERFAALMRVGALAPKKPRRWDGKWRLLVFDISEARRGVREKIRRTLATLGFLRLQDSVWVYPYDCEDFMTILKADLRIGKDMLYVIADQIEYDAPLRARFGLPKRQKR